MKKKKILSLIVALTMLVSLFSVPAFAEARFTLMGNIVLPGSDVAPAGGLVVTVEYRSDKGTPSNPGDDYILSQPVALSAGTTSAFFSLNLPYTAVGARYTLGYTVLQSNQYWDRGYYASGIMQYFQKGETFFTEGTYLPNLVITPLKASQISGMVYLPAYSVTQAAVSVDVTAKSEGVLGSADDNIEAKTSVNVTNSSIAYSIKVPTTAANAGYTVMYETASPDYEKQGWYNSTGTVLASAAASKVDVSGGNRSDINLFLIKKTVQNYPYKIEGKVELPGTETAPAGGLTVNVEYRSDKGTSSLSDDYVYSLPVILSAGAHESTFTLSLPSTAPHARFTIGYSVPSASQYWDRGYYVLSGMQYYQAGQMYFYEGSNINGLIITPLKASLISGSVGLPAYSSTQAAIKVDVTAKTVGLLPGADDDYEAKTSVNVSSSAVAYTLKVPTTVTTASYIVIYKTDDKWYEKQGWYSTTGTALTATAATKVDVSGGNPTNINLTLIKKTTPDPVTNPCGRFDFNHDGKLDAKDQVFVSRLMGAKKKYQAFFDLNNDGVINVTDLKIIKAEIEKFKKLQHSEKHMSKEKHHK